MNGPHKKAQPGAALDLFREDELDNLFNIAFPPPNVQYCARDDEAAPGEGLLVSFMEACMANLGWTRGELAEVMATDVILIDAIFDRTLPESAIDESLIADLAHALGYEPSILRMMVEYSKTPQADLEILVDKLIDFAVDGTDAVETIAAFSTQAEELDTLQQELASLLLNVFGGYYSAEIADDRKRRMMYQALIKKVKAVIASYQRDMEEAQALLSGMRENYRAEINSIQKMVGELHKHDAIKAIMEANELDREDLREGLRSRIMEKIENI